MGSVLNTQLYPPHSTSALALPPSSGDMLVQIQRNYLGRRIMARESSEGWPLSTLSWWDPCLPQGSILAVWNQSGNDGGEKGEDVFGPDLEVVQPPRLISCSLEFITWPCLTSREV